MNYKVVIIVLIIFTEVCTFGQNYIYVEDYGDLFDSIQSQSIFSDQKKFVDVTPRFSAEEILQKYHHQREKQGFHLRDFVGENFDTLFVDTTSILKHIDYLWNFLSRQPDEQKQNSTLIPLKHPYIVPGGRFREIYYWDSYFTMLGLEQAKRYSMIQSMLDNISDLILSHGHMPNGNRTYYLSRSQPPFFSLMIDLYAKSTEDTSVYKKYYSALQKEYRFWNQGKDDIQTRFCGKGRIVMLDRDEYLNRYWDNKNNPRPESYLYDIDIKRESEKDSTIYRNIRAAAESGWDFSSRWFADGKSLKSINTTDIIPVDLNCLLYHMEMILSRSCSPDSSKMYLKAAKKRKEMVLKYCWNAEEGFFFDYNFITQQQTKVYSLAALFPMFFNMVDEVIAKRVEIIIKHQFLKDGGLITTLNETGQQWDAPNGWAPLQWVAYQAFVNYNNSPLANEIAQRWIKLNAKVFFETNKMMEKYNVVDVDLPGGGGEYKNQDGFGWTNGVFLKMWNELHDTGSLD